MEKKKKSERNDALLCKKIWAKKGIFSKVKGELVGVLVAIYTALNYIYNLLYQLKCEEFYRIPGKYFHATVDNKLLYLGCIIILLFICAIPLIMKKYDEKSENLTKGSIVYISFLSIAIGMEVGFLNVSNLVEIMRQTYKMNKFFRCVSCFLDNYAVFTIFIVIALFSGALLGFTLLEQLRHIKKTWVRNIINFLFIISFVVSFVIMVYGTIIRMGIRIEDKTKYEFVTIEDKEYVILSEHEEKMLIVPYEYKENGQYVFTTSQYRFFDKYQGIYRYDDLKYCPEINRGVKDVNE